MSLCTLELKQTFLFAVIPLFRQDFIGLSETIYFKLCYQYEYFIGHNAQVGASNHHRKFT